eukprot:Awhi_evm2s3509
MGHMICEPKQCSTNDIDANAEDVTEDGWLMYVSHFTDYEHKLLVHLNPAISQIELDEILIRFPSSDYNSGTSPLNFKQLVVTMDHTINVDTLINDENVLKVENYGSEDFSSVYFERSADISKTPSEKIAEVYKGGAMDYYSGTSSIKEVHDLDLNSANPLREVSRKYNSAENIFGNQGETSYSIKTGGSGKSKHYLGEFGVPMVLNGEYECYHLILYTYMSLPSLNGEYASYHLILSSPFLFLRLYM